MNVPLVYTSKKKESVDLSRVADDCSTIVKFRTTIVGNP